MVSIMTCHGRQDTRTPWVVDDSLCEPHFGEQRMEGRHRTELSSGHGGGKAGRAVRRERGRDAVRSCR